MKKRANLSPAEREDVKRLYATKKFSMRKLAAHFGCSKSTIDRIVKDQAPSSVQEEKAISSAPTPKPAKEPPKHPPSTAPTIQEKPHLPPLKFKGKKLEEVNLDLHACRLRGQYNVLPALHRLHLSLYDECQQLHKEQEEIAGSIEAEGLINGILSTIAQLPPVLKQKLEKEILNKESRVITFPKRAEND